ncbi:hypothetical protein AMTRI_Chr01g135060 [Amborella trichopoda]
MDGRCDASETLRNKCAACYKQYNKVEHLVEHIRVSYHSVHEPTCGICKKHCRSFESLREHLIGPLPKVECARIFSTRGCSLCLNIFDCSNSLRRHRDTCQLSSPLLYGSISRLSLSNMYVEGNLASKNGRNGSQAVGLACQVVGGGIDGSLNICARVCLVDEDENVIFHSYVKPHIPVTNYRYEMTGIRAEHLRDALPLKQVQKKIQDILYNGEVLWRIRSKGGKAMVLVGHGLDQDLECLLMDYPSHLIRDTAKYPPLMKTSKLSNSLKYLTQAYLGYDIQSGIHDPYEDSVGAMRLYKRMHSQLHPTEDPLPPNATINSTNLPSWRLKEFERMTPDALLDISRSDYYCWCLDSKQSLDY